MHQLLKNNSIEKMLAEIPKGIEENLEYRVNLHNWLATDDIAQKDYISLMLAYPVVAFDTLFWTLDTRKTNAASRNCQFILRPQQEKVINVIRDCVAQKFPEGENDLAIDKSREEGATELLMKYVTLLVMFIPDTVAIVGSRSEDLVDRTGAKGTLFSKIDHTIEHLPNWLTKKLHWNRVFRTLENKDLNSVIEGEATNENFAAGKRATVLVLDEFGRVLPSLASAIADTVMDVSKSVIYNSTHFYGSGHPFCKLIRSGNIKVVKLPWYLNPEKKEGLYTSTEEGKITLIDTQYYKKNYPDILNEFGTSFDILDLEKIDEDKRPPLKADGCLEIDGEYRSPWHDKQEKRRSRRDLAMNVWMNPEGATEMFFDSFVNNKIRAKFITSPSISGDIELTKEKGKRIQKAIVVHSLAPKFRWWGKLKMMDGMLHPNQEHNYVIGCDISFGTGASNSTAMVVDVNTRELVGEYVTSALSPENFAELVCALGEWVGGTGEKAFIIWERNGGQGINFGRRILANGYINVYTKTDETSKTRRRLKKYGWDNTGGANGTKQDVLTRLQIALKAGLENKPDRTYLRIFSEDVVDELDSYMFFASGDIDASELVEENSGARARHGDRIIGLALCVLAMQDQPKARGVRKSSPPFNSFAWRQNERKTKEALKKDDWGEKNTKNLRGF